MRKIEAKLLELCIPLATLLGGIAIIMKLTHPNGF